MRMFGLVKKIFAGKSKPSPKVQVELAITFKNSHTLRYYRLQENSSLMWHFRDFYKWFVCRTSPVYTMVYNDCYTRKTSRTFRREDIQEFKIYTLK